MPGERDRLGSQTAERQDGPAPAGAVPAQAVAAARSGGRAGLVIAGHVARQVRRGALVWGIVFGGTVASSALAFASAYPTPAARRALVASLGSNLGVQALLGPARHIDTAAGFTAWRCLVLLCVVGGVWALLASTRALRGEEDAGRWELLLAGRTTRRRASASALAGLGAGLVLLWAITAVLTVATGRSPDVDFSLSASLYLSLALAAGPAIFLTVGALSSQLAATRRQAAGLGAAVLGVAYLLRMLADSTPSLSWLRWLSPIGWVEELRPLTGSRPTVLVPIALLVGVLAALTVHLAGVRDTGAGILPSRDTAPARTRLLDSPLGLAVRLTRPVTLGWAAAVGGLGLVIGLVANAAAQATSGSDMIRQFYERLGSQEQGAVSYIGAGFLTVGTLVALAASGQVGAIRQEEADEHLDHLLARPVSRRSWLAGRLAVATGALVVVALTAGVLTWAGAALQHTGIGLPRLLLAAVNTLPSATFVLGVGTLLYGLAPRVATAVAYGVVAWSLLLEMVGSLLKLSPWLLDLSLFHHVALVPAADPRWAAAGILAGIGLVAGIAGATAFDRRDLAAA